METYAVGRHDAYKLIMNCQAGEIRTQLTYNCNADIDELTGAAVFSLKSCVILRPPPNRLKASII